MVACPLPSQECRLNRPSSAAQLQMRIESALAGSPCLGQDKLSREPSFIVMHYAGPVRYHTAGLVEKNKVGLAGVTPHTLFPILRCPPELPARVQHHQLGPLCLRSLLIKCDLAVTHITLGLHLGFQVEQLLLTSLKAILQGWVGWGTGPWDLWEQLFLPPLCLPNRTLFPLS